MTDIVERLRAWHTPGETVTGDVQLYLDAADEIERLREENDIMRRHLNLHPDKPLGNELRAEIERLQEQITVLRELRDCDQREIARLLALKP